MRLAERVRKIQASGIRRIFDMAATLETPVNLSIGQPHFDVPEAAKEAAIRAIRDGKNNYTPAPGIPLLREKISAWFHRRGIDHEAVMVTAGASGALTLSIMSLAGPGDEVLIPDPYFVSYKQLAITAGAEPVTYDTYPNFVPNPEIIAEKITARTAAIIVNSPNNPTGAVWPEDVVTNIAKTAEKHGVAVISDEVYDCFYYDEKPFSPGKVCRNVITINALSKSASMTGWRLGFACGPAEVINEMVKLQQFTFVNAPQPVQWAACEV
ncbi:MAG TPA: aminotransferase class I/II-fold pyridoxal phosphate-dependent enzyme, partial [Planctomycetes bacterium]|nr:aminotransferase class I/II-fold pyridoxal phosphate-dependent enzyme [Planctomycetota bacterium]